MTKFSYTPRCEWIIEARTSKGRFAKRTKYFSIKIAQQAKKRMQQEAPELRYEIKHINQSKKIIKK